MQFCPSSSNFSNCNNSWWSRSANQSETSSSSIANFSPVGATWYNLSVCSCITSGGGLLCSVAIGFWDSRALTKLSAGCALPLLKSTTFPEVWQLVESLLLLVPTVTKSFSSLKSGSTGSLSSLWALLLFPSLCAAGGSAGLMVWLSSEVDGTSSVISSSKHSSRPLWDASCTEYNRSNGVHTRLLRHSNIYLQYCAICFGEIFLCQSSLVQYIQLALDEGPAMGHNIIHHMIWATKWKSPLCHSAHAHTKVVVPDTYNVVAKCYSVLLTWKLSECMHTKWSHQLYLWPPSSVCSQRISDQCGRLCLLPVPKSTKIGTHSTNNLVPRPCLV